MASSALMPAETRAVDAPALVQSCLACHGENAFLAGGTAPAITGQPFTVIQDALMLFAANGRPCTVMCAIAASLSQGEIKALANYLEQQDFVSVDQESDPDLAVLGSELHLRNGCDNCHSEGGRNGLGMAPVLAGQWKPYLRDALLQVRAGKRKGPKAMNGAIRSMSEEDIEALLEFYARGRD